MRPWPLARAVGASLALLVAMPGGSLVASSRPGLALRQAVEALERGAHGEAAWRLAAVADEHSVVADVAEQLRVEALLEGGRPEEAAAAGLAFLRRHPDSPLRGRVLHSLGDAYAARGDEGSARSTWSQAQGETRDREERAALRAAVARSWERSEEPARAAAEWLELWSREPGEPEAKEAEEALARLEQSLGRRFRSATAWERRSDELYDLRRNEEALEACDRALAMTTTKATRATLRRRRAYLLFRLRRYPEAVDAFAALGSGKEARFWRARSLARAGRIEESIAAFEALVRDPRRSMDARALYLASTLLEERDPPKAARQQAEVAARAPQASLRRAARWRLGWRAWNQARYQDASREFARLAKQEPDRIDALRPRYWWARSREALGDEAGARAFAEMARDYPFTYYGWRAAQRVGRAEPLPAKEARKQRPSQLDVADLARPRALVEAGLDEEAQRALRQLARGKRGEDRLILARLYQSAGAYHSAQRLVIDPNLLRLAAGPRPREEELWWLAWPDAFAPHVEASAQRHGVESALVYAVMREESGYRPKVRSLVGARGLTQIMPSTGERLARDVGRTDFHPDQLFEPEVNLDLGAFYLAELLRRFEGRASAAIASYNAGPAAVSRWLRERGDREDDEWVEGIPYSETRSYARRVLRSLYVYRTLYGTS